MELILPPNAHELAHHRLHVSITSTRTRENYLVSSFPSREDLIQVRGAFLLGGSPQALLGTLLPCAEQPCVVRSCLVHMPGRCSLSQVAEKRTHLQAGSSQKPPKQLSVFLCDKQHAYLALWQ